MDFKTQILTDILPYIQNPAKYIGKELGAIVKDHKQVKARLVLAFPDTYEIGMSHLGSKIIYSVVNNRPDFVCERTFAPWSDLENLLRQKNMPLFSLETFTPLKEFDIIGFSIQHELCYTNILNMLDLASVPLWARERTDGHYPLIVGGGPLCFSPEPLSDFFDIFILGDGEEAVLELLEQWTAYKSQHPSDKKTFLLSVAKSIKGAYVPALYTAEYSPKGTYLKTYPVSPSVPATIEKRIYDISLDSYPLSYIVPFTKIVHDRIVLEIMRGCSQGCRFCQAGMIYRPVREKPAADIIRLALHLLKLTGYEEISLSSLSSTDYSGIHPLIKELYSQLKKDNIAISLPSLRADTVSDSILSIISQIKKTGITIAPEAGSQRLRDYINKKITREDILQSAHKAYKNGWQLIKLYFMVGLPRETYEDIDEMIALIHEVSALKGTISHGKGKVNVTISFFVPKAHTPLQWERIRSLDYMSDLREYILSKVKSKHIALKFHDYRMSYIEALFAKGDRRLGRVLYTAFRKGCKFDNWQEFFNFESWIRSFEEQGLNPEEYLNQYTGVPASLPYDHLSIGVAKQFLLEEYARAQEFKITPDCRIKCVRCGICDNR